MEPHDRLQRERRGDRTRERARVVAATREDDAGHQKRAADDEREPLANDGGSPGSQPCRRSNSCARPGCRTAAEGDPDSPVRPSKPITAHAPSVTQRRRRPPRSGARSAESQASRRTSARGRTSPRPTARAPGPAATLVPIAPERSRARTRAESRRSPSRTPLKRRHPQDRGRVAARRPERREATGSGRARTSMPSVTRTARRRPGAA